MQTASLKSGRFFEKLYLYGDGRQELDPQATSGSNIKVDCETQTETNIRQRDCSNTDEQEVVRRLKEKTGSCPN